MLNRWMKSLIAVAALGLALPLVANAQTSRVEGMSVQGDYIKDYTAIYTYSSEISHVGNLVYGEFGSTEAAATPVDDRAVGAVLGNLFDGRFGTWGIHLREWTPNLGQGDITSNPGVGAGGQDPNANNNHSFDLMWGKRMGGTSLGLRLNRSVFETKLSVPPATTTITTLAGGDNFNRNVWGFGAGVGFEVNPTSSFEASLIWQNRTFENSTTPIVGTNTTEDSPTTYQFAARLLWQYQPNLLVVPVFKWYSFDLSTKSTTAAASTTANNTLKGWQIGAAGNWTLNQNDLFVLGLTFAHNSVEQDVPIFGSGIVGAAADNSKIDESIYPQVFAALETHVNSWLTLRFGANQDVYAKIKTTPRTPATDNAAEQTFSRFDMHLGAGVKVGNLQFDAIVANDFFQNLGWLGSGNSSDATTTGAYFPKVTATYAF
ncbi:MAG TPA: hypothetical protein VMJ70_03840 [Candidatus Sulfotelmatobacter sp.]|nr:hypothetical protein [Candidatus Sulfotelmatobacter sp.]